MCCVILSEDFLCACFCCRHVQVCESVPVLFTLIRGIYWQRLSIKLQEISLANLTRGAANQTHWDLKCIISHWPFGGSLHITLKEHSVCLPIAFFKETRGSKSPRSGPSLKERHVYRSCLFNFPSGLANQD